MAILRKKKGKGGSKKSSGGFFSGLSDKQKKYLKWTFWIVVAVSVYFSFGWLKQKVLEILSMNPTIWYYYKVIEAEVQARSLLGLFYASFFGALFFIGLPVEIIFLYYLGLNYYFVQIFSVVLVGNLLGMAVNYFLGWLLGSKLMEVLMKDKYKDFKKKLKKAGGFLIIVGNIIPFPIEIFTFFIGAMRYSFLRLMIYTGIGKVSKFLLLYMGYKYFIKYISPYLGDVTFSSILEILKNSFIG